VVELMKEEEEGVSYLEGLESPLQQTLGQGVGNYLLEEGEELNLGLDLGGYNYCSTRFDTFWWISIIFFK